MALPRTFSSLRATVAPLLSTWRKANTAFALGFAVLLCSSSIAVAGLPQAATTPATDAQSGAPRQSVNLMHIGNSFSWDATTYLPQLVEAGGKNIRIFASAIGGCSFERHARHLAEAKAGDAKGNAYKVTPSLGLADKEKKSVSLPDALAAQQWDFVTIQQVSSQSFKPESYEPHAEAVIAAIREGAPQAEILIHQTWAYRDDHPLLAREGLTPQTMHEGLSAAYTQLGERYGLGFLPSGNAIHNARNTPQWTFVKDPTFDYENRSQLRTPNEGGLHRGLEYRKDRKGNHGFRRDAFHLNPAGRYLTGCVWYEILFNDSVLDVDFIPEGLTPEQAADLRRIAHETVAAYRANANKL